MPEKTDQHLPPKVSDPPAVSEGLSPEETLMLARIEHQLLAVQVEHRIPGWVTERPSRAEGVSQVSPLAHLAR